ncbi:UbiX family flavin prenyltransferase [Flexibacterium corallicola]|uniref:UbiX family flavin prenyltransferase n=1 Tax=Flexibacterium corallicola TaxID=3037259 RepID=UPI00286ECDB8|nr:UbiX family flavin prenyltransferase [Pseudovibrio sp. M1P-2-3]
MTGKRIIVGVTGASGSILAVRALEILRDLGVESHLVLSSGAAVTISHELGESGVEQLNTLAHTVYDGADMSSAIASGSYPIDGMLITPCSMRTLSATAYSFSDSLLTRAADVTLKERRKLVVAPREAPLHQGHLEAMLKLTQMGAVICPPVPAFYNGVTKFEAQTREIAARSIACLGIDPKGALSRWKVG